MENLLGILKKENKEREKRLIISDRKLISDMVAYIKTKKSVIMMQKCFVNH